MWKSTIFIALALACFTVACKGEAPASSVNVEAPTPTLEPTPQTRSTDTPKPTSPARLTSTSEPSSAAKADPTPTFTKERIHWLFGGWEENMIHATITGAGLEKLKITLRSNVEVSILVAIIPGTLFEPDSPSVQTMVAREYREVVLEPSAEVSLEIEVACVKNGS